jgi:ribosomal protein L7/L12
MGLLSISTILLSLLCLAGLMAAAMVVISIWSHNQHISKEGHIDEPRLPELGPSEQLIDEVCDLAQSGQKIEAIKLYRQNTGAGLVEAKEAVEALDCNEEA